MRHKLRWSIYGAIYLIVFRTLAAILISVPTVGHTLFVLPTVTTPTWLVGIRIGGPVTSERLIGSLQESAIIAGILLTFGVLNAVVPPRVFLRFIPRRFATISTALLIAFNTYPRLLESGTRIRQAQKIRSGKKPFIGRIALPLLEETLSSAVSLSYSMQSKSQLESRNSPQDFTTTELSITHPGEVKPVISKLSLTIKKGDFVLVTGATGSGKTSLLQFIADSTVGSSAYVPQVPEDSFITDSVSDELTFGIESPEQDCDFIARHTTIMQHLGIDDLAHREISTLSGGEKQLVALAAALVRSPSLVILDEPTSQLDTYARIRLQNVLVELNAIGVAIVIAEHNIEEFKACATQVVELGTSPQSFARLPQSASANISCIVGEVGTGKTTYLKTLIHEPLPGYVPQNPGDILYGTSVSGECEQNDKDWNLERGTTLRSIEKLISLPQTCHPRDLSAGQRLLFAIALASARQPELLIVDEPTRGLDSSRRAELAHFLLDYAQNHKVVIATHDLDFAHSISSTIMDVSDVAR